jgi:drug/metabolite transporter (DMT)-like permease
MTAVAVALALTSALCYALAAALQQHAAEQVDSGGGVRLLAHLSTRPRWLAGVTAMVLGAGLHVLALSLGPLALVQPIGVTGLAFALPLGAVLHGRRVGKRQVLAAVAVGAGLLVVLASLQVSVQAPILTAAHSAVLAAITVVVVMCCALLGRQLRTQFRAVVFAAGAGVAFGVTSALVHLVAVEVGEIGVARAIFDWPTLLLLAAAPAGLALSQSAYQVGSLAAVQPTLNVVDPLTAIAVGALLLGEPLYLSAAGAAAAAAGTAVVLAGTVVLARYQSQGAPVPDSPASRGRRDVVHARSSSESEPSQCA